MKKLLVALMFCACLVLSAGNAHAYLTNWYFNPDGTGLTNAVQVENFLDFTGSAVIQNDLVNLTFDETGDFVSTAFDSTNLYAINGFTNTYLTGSFIADGYLTPAGFFFNPGGSLTINDAASNTIASFNLLSGGGEVADTTIYAPVSNGIVSAVFEVEDVLSGYWFTPAGKDLASLNDEELSFLFGYTTTNATLTDQAITYAQDGVTPIAAELEIGNNGQFRLNAVPEPASMALFGTGLLGMALRRKKRS